jgi:ribose transport system permease protein
MKNTVSETMKPEGTCEEPRMRVADFLKKITGFREATLLIIIVIIGFAMSFLSPYFLTVNNIKAIVMSFATEGIVVVGMTIVMIQGGFDLSVGSVMALTMIIAGKLFLLGVPILIGVPIALILAASVGFLIGQFVTKIGLSPFITTLAFMGMVRGTCFIITQGSPLSLYTLPDGFKQIGQGNIFGIPYVIIIFLVIVFISDFLLRRSSLLRMVFYTGSNEEAAVYSGINTKKVKILVYITSSFLAGLAGILYLSRFSAATPLFGTGLEMTTISAAVIGGASLNGGEGTILGSVLGMALLAIITSALVLLNVSVYWQDLIKGIILLSAVSLDYITHAKNN